MERRVSPRTRTSAPLAVARGKISYAARCVELSQTGLLAVVPKAVRESSCEYVSAHLVLDTGMARVLLRRVAVRGRNVAYAIVDIDDASQAFLTDFLFDRLHAALPKRRPRRPPMARRAA